MTASGLDSVRSRVRRGEIWWVNFDPTQGSEIRKTRPAVVISADALNRARRTVVVVPLSSGLQPRPPIVVVRCLQATARSRSATRFALWTSDA